MCAHMCACTSTCATVCMWKTRKFFSYHPWVQGLNLGVCQVWQQMPLPTGPFYQPWIMLTENGTKLNVSKCSFKFYISDAPTD